MAKIRCRIAEVGSPQAHARKIIASVMARSDEIANVCSSSVLPASHFNLFCRIQMQKDEILIKVRPGS